MVGLRPLFLVLAMALLSVPLHAADEDYFDQGLFEDALPQSQPTKAKPGEWLVTINADITVHYTFSNNTKDTYKIVYHLSLNNPVGSFPTVVRGTASIKPEITGYLAKWTTGQCLLQIDVSAVPYEIAVSKESDDKLKLALQFKQKILEDWQSLCTFVDAPDSRFYTRGEPEKWIADALQKAEPSLDKLSVPTAPKNRTETQFKIPKYTVNDGRIGTADVDGQGKVIIDPPSEPVIEKK